MLIIDTERGYAFDDGPAMQYGEQYWLKHKPMGKSLIGRKLNKFRADLVARHGVTRVVDFGIGDGAFLRKCKGTGFGYDVNPLAESWLRDEGRWLDPYEGKVLELVNGITFWDSIEHVRDPSKILRRIPRETLAFFSLPIIDDLDKLRDWYHYRPCGCGIKKDHELSGGCGVEHHHYFTHTGFQMFLHRNGLKPIEVHDAETRIGRKDVLTYVAEKITDLR
ncbi:MAG: hypothetical protein JWN86_1783 [Planctomycetota bacterium]|nr:hypothetical protein [Planctomycetota bacterium]